MRLEHFDVTNAFTQSDIDCDIFVEPPKGFSFKTKDGKPAVLKLKRALYGTKQASRLWQEKLASHLCDNMGFSRSTADPCLFSRRDKDGSIILLGVYVDDIVVAHNGLRFDWFKEKFTDGFRSKHIGKLDWFLGIGIGQSVDFSVSLSQSSYIDKLVEKFIPNSQTDHSMPCNPNTFQNLSTASDDKEREKVSKHLYLQLVGSLLYLSTMTRPDIAYHMSILCSFMHDPSPQCYEAALNLLQFVRCTKDRKLVFTGKPDIPEGIAPDMHDQISKNHGLLAYSDASWHKPDKLGFNMFGYTVRFMGSTISFAAKNLKVIALSSAESEYAAAAYTCKELSVIRNVLYDLGCPVQDPIPIAVDNKAAIDICHNMGVTGRNKHFQDSIHYLRYSFVTRHVIPSYVKTTDQHADGFTKPLAKPQFRIWSDRFFL